LTRLSFIFIGLLLYSCSDRQESKKTNVSVPVIQPADSTPTLSAENYGKYSRSFIDKLNEGPLQYELKDSLLINGSDTAYFPTELPLNKKVIFEGCKNNICFTLTVERKNYTTLVYTLKRANSITDEGEAVILAGFFLGAETDEEDKTGLSYLSTEYSSENSDCYFGIRIGTNEHDQLCAKVDKYCKDKSKNIDLEDCPTLYKK
jgi:hypothetical protein